MSCEKCGREIKNYGVFLGGVRCVNWCFMSSEKIADGVEERLTEDETRKTAKSDTKPQNNSSKNYTSPIYFGERCR